MCQGLETPEGGEGGGLRVKVYSIRVAYCRLYPSRVLCPSRALLCPRRELPALSESRAISESCISASESRAWKAEFLTHRDTSVASLSKTGTSRDPRTCRYAHTIKP